MLILLVLVIGVQSDYVIDSPVDNVYWCGGSIVVTPDDDIVNQENEENLHRKVIYVQSNKGIIYRSADYGQKWENVTFTLQQKFNLTDQYRSKDVLQSSNDSHILYLLGTPSFQTTDCGKTYRLFNDNKLFGYKFNKMDKNQILAFQDKKCDRTLKNCKELYKKSLLVTLDGGLSWLNALENVRDAAWDKLVHYEMVPDSRIIVTHIDDEGELRVSYSDDFFKTTRPIEKDAFGFYQTQTYLFILVRPDPYSVGYDLKMSPHLGDTYFPQEIILPLDDQSKHTFTVLDVTDSQVYLSVSHSEDLSKITNIYMSDGNEFTVSLLGNVRSQDTGHCDFERIKSMKGVYIANIFDYEEVERTIQRRKRINTEKDMKSQQADKLDQYKKSLITYDFGGEWHPIKAPKYSYNGQPLNCNGDCSLHLRGRTQTSSMIYSSQDAIGIIIGTGNTGLYLSQPTQTYLSRDGGHNWYEILNGSYIYEIGDHGGLIVFAKQNEIIKQVQYTLDEGMTFQNYTFNKKMTVDNIVTEPSNFEQKFLLYGRIQGEKSNTTEDDDYFTRFDYLRGVLVPIDLSNLNLRKCQLPEDPSHPDSDYEYWIPQNYYQKKCLFGQKMKYTRRKREAKCRNVVEEKKTIIEKCPCTEEDWECDIGYHRKIGGGPCTPMTKGSPDNCTGHYLQTQGYRKIPGDECEGGVYLGYIEVECPNKDEVKKEPVEDDKPEPVIQKQERPRFEPKQFKSSLLDKYGSLFLYIVAIILIFLLRNQIFNGLRAIRGASNIKKQKSYYPPSEEELQQQRKQQMPKIKEYEMLNRQEEDEEAGL
ncbi:hypothetical protein pb186bvf_009629 [Paramecium bursaria]